MTHHSKGNLIARIYWVVTAPTPDSELCDILFDATFARMVLQGAGGLDSRDVIGVYADEAHARQVALGLLAHRDRSRAALDSSRYDLGTLSGSSLSETERCGLASAGRADDTGAAPSPRRA